jgi:hypothetical protein
MEIINKRLRDLIEDTIIEMHKSELLTDDLYDEALENEEYYKEAVEYLAEQLGIDKYAGTGKKQQEAFSAGYDEGYKIAMEEKTQ